MAATQAWDADARRSRVPHMLRVYAEPRTWGALAYILIGFPFAIAGFVYVVTALSVSAGLAVTLIGIPLLGLSVALARLGGAAYRGLGRTFLGLDVEAPQVRRRPGLLGYLTERNGWRAMLFMLLEFPLSIFEFAVTVALFAYGWGGLTYPIWYRAVHRRVDGRVHHGLQLVNSHYADSADWVLLVCAVGLVLVLVGPWVVRAMTQLDRAMIRGLLGPTAAERRIRDLEQTRSMAVDDAATALRRIERDLHDGAQARLVSLAMSLGLAKEELESSEPQAALAKVHELVDAAHREAKDTLVELRDLARGIHPPALDRGLPEALTTLAARSTVPTTLQVNLPERPSPAIETIAYFCTAELLTNVAKHSGAHHASVDVRTVGERLFLRVGDDGAGGAQVGRAGGSGLTGLADRVATVDGRLTVDSPEGGPTLVTIEIPV